MMTQLASLLTAFALVCTINTIFLVPQAGCYPAGAQRESCSQMQVQHSASAQQCTPPSCPHVLSVEAVLNAGTRVRTGENDFNETYQCSRDYELLLASTMNAFEGYLVEARTTTDTFSSSAEIWGSWLVNVEADDPYHTINCSDSADFITTAATQNSPNVTNAVTLYWRAPPTPLTTQEYNALPERITFWFTIVEQFAIFFERIEGPTLNRSCIMPFDCTIDPCQNGGTCNNGVNCECCSGFTGDFCEVNIDDCTPTSCQNGGLCTDGVNSFTCECANGFSGVTCDTATISITIDYTPPPDVVLGENEYRAASSILLMCELAGAMQFTFYTWDTTLDAGMSEKSQIRESILSSEDTGSHTCMASDSTETLRSGTIEINVVGAGIYVQVGDESVPLGALPNNSLVISRPSSSATRVRFLCRSTSASSNVGELIGIDGVPVTNNPFSVDTAQVGTLEATNSNANTDIGSGNQGVFTCRIPDDNGRTVDINIGVYSNDVHSPPSLQESLPRRLTSSSAFTLSCPSSESPPTIVTWLKDGVEVVVDGTTIQEAKVIENRATSSYVNMLLINMEPDNLLGSYSCNVNNTLGSSGFSDDLTISGLQITGHEEPLIIGTSASINCTSDLDVTTIEWLDGMGTVVVMSSIDAILGLELDPVTSDLHNQVFTCRVTSPYGTQEQNITVEIAPPLNVSITIDYTPPPNAVLGENEYRAASSILLTCEVEGAEGAVTYSWVTTLGEGSEDQIRESILGSEDTGNHTCMAVDSTGNSGSATIEISVVGAGIYVLEGDERVPLGALPNNSLVISRSSTSTVRVRFLCSSTSVSSGVGELIGLGGSPVASTNFFIDLIQLGTVEVVNTNQNINIGSGNQGVFTCRIPDENGRTVDINIGIYSNDIQSPPFLQESLPRRLPSSSAFTLSCTSFLSPPTIVTWLKDGVEVVVDGTTIQEAKVIENRATSSYVNMLLINMEPDNLLGSYSCNVNNTLGSSGFSADLTIIGLQITGHEEPLIIGTSASINCASDLDVTTIEWLDGMGTVVVMSSIDAILGLELDPVTSDLHNQVFTCRVTSPYGTQEQNITVEIAPLLNVSITIDYTPPPDAVLGENEYRAASSILLTCEVEVTEGAVTYSWVTTLGEGSEDQIRESILGSEDTGNHTCAAIDSTGNSGTATVEINVVGAGIYVLSGDQSVPTGALPNNGLAIGRNNFVEVRFLCISSATSSDAGRLIGLDGIEVASGDDSPFTIITTQPGTLDVRKSSDVESTGVFTCRILVASGDTVDANIGIYPNGFNTPPFLQESLPRRLTSSSAFTLSCTSFLSPPTIVTWLKDGVEVVVDGTTIQEAKVIENRATSSYVNMLLINMEPDNLLGSYSCNVNNTLGSSGFSDDLTINGLQITGHEERLIVGTNATLSCSSDLDVTTIEWLNGTGTVIVMSDTDTTLDLEFDPVTADLDSSEVTCRVTSPYGTQEQSVTIAVNTPQTRLSVTAVPIHPRSFRLEWVPVIFDGAPVTGYAVSVTATQGGSTVNTIDFIISDPTTSNFTFNNLSPFTYQLGVQGILYSCTMQVVNEVGTGPSSDVATTVIPRCASKCDFQFEEADSNCNCMCGPAYMGKDCDEPAFTPRNVQAAITEPSLPEPGLNVTWEPPPAMTLDWRQITSYVVTIDGTGVSSTPEEVSMSITHLAFPPGLTKGTSYLVTVSTRSDLNESATTSISVFITPDTTSEVQNLSATSNATTIQVLWDPPSVIPVNAEVIRYRIDYENVMDTADNGTVYTPNATIVVVFLTDLSPGMEYRVTVAAENLGGLGVAQFILVSTQNIAPQTRLSVTAVPIHPRSFRLEWVPVTFDGAPVTGYAVSVTATQDSSTVNTIDFIISDPTTSNFTFNNLSPFTYQLGEQGILYSCTMQVVNEVGTGPSSDMATTVIPPCAGTCDFQFQVADENCSSCSCNPSYTGDLCDVPTFSPRNVQVIISSPTSLTITWEPPLVTTLDWRQITGYTVTLTDFEGLTRPRHVPMSTTQVTFAPLIQGSNHTAVVSTQSDLNDSASTTIFAFLPPDTPIEVSNLVATSNMTTIQVQWDPPNIIPPNGDLTRYRVDYQNAMDIRIDNGTIYTPDATTRVVFLTDLSPGTEYRVTVAAENLGGLGTAQFTLVSTQDNVCPMDSYGLSTDVDCTPCPDSSGSIEGTVNISGCVCLPGYSGNDGGPCDPCEVGTFKAITGNFPCLSCSTELSTSTNASTVCDTCRFSSGNPVAGEMCYPFETTTQLETPQGANIQSTQISLSWQFRDRAFTIDGEDCCPVIGYLLWCTAVRGLTPQGHSQSMDIPNAVSTSATFTNLQPLVEYMFNVTIMAQRNPGSNSIILVGPPSAEITVITRSNGDSISALPQITTIAPVNANNISVVSYAMNSDIVELITEFTLRIVNLESGSASTTPPQTPAPSGQIIVLNINPQLTYQFVLQTTIGGIQYSSEKNMSFLVIPPPSDVTLTAVNGTFVTITWSVLDGVSGYQIDVSPATPDGTPTVIMVIGQSVSSHGIAGLTPFLTYNIRVTGVGVDGNIGTPSNPTNITTPEEPPGPPTNVQVVIIDNSLIEVRWSPPDMPNGIITEYVIVITPDDGNPTTVSVTSEQESITLPRPTGSFSVAVFAGNNAGQGAIQDAELVDQSGGSGADSQTLTIIIAASAGASLLIMLFILCLIICCCCVYRKTRTGSAGSFKQQYSFGAPWVDENAVAHIPGMNVSRDNELPGTRYKKFQGEFEQAPVVPLPFGQVLPQGIQYMETNFNAEGMYEEVGANMRPHAANHDTLSRRQLPMRPLDNKPPSYLDVVKEATPEDYDNEALYQTMEEFYFKDVDQSKILAAFEVDRSKIKMQGQIGQGEFGRVVKGIGTGIVTGEPQSIVAVKMLKEGATDSNRKDFLGEAQMLAHFKHPNVMGLVGISTVMQPILVIIPYMPNGDLKNYLKKQKELCKQSEKGVRQFGLAEQLKIAVQIAKGMEYLASKFFIHRDLAARNVLVDEKNNVKISDFGLSRALAKEDTYYHLSQCMKLPVKWMALESIEYRKFSTYSDIWSFGVVLWEIFSFGATPYKGIAARNITAHLLSGNRLSCPEDCPQEVYDLMRRCWSTKKEERTTFTQLKVDLMRIASSNTAKCSEDAYYY